MEEEQYHRIQDLGSVERKIKKDLEYEKKKLSGREIDERIREGIEEHIKDHIKRNIEREIMKEIGYGLILFHNLTYEIFVETKGREAVQIIAVNVEYQRLKEKRVGDTWSFEVKGERESREFTFGVGKREEVNYYIKRS